MWTCSVERGVGIVFASCCGVIRGSEVGAGALGGWLEADELFDGLCDDCATFMDLG